MSPDLSMASEDEAQEWLENWTGDIERRAAQARALSDQVAHLAVSAGTPDGTVEVTVGGSGAMIGLRLGEAVRKWPAGDIAAQILTVMRRAQAKLSSRIAEIAAETVGADSSAARAVVSSFERRYPYPQAGSEDTDAGSASDWQRRGR